MVSGRTDTSAHGRRCLPSAGLPPPLFRDARGNFLAGDLGLSLRVLIGMPFCSASVHSSHMRRICLSLLRRASPAFHSCSSSMDPRGEGRPGLAPVSRDRTRRHVLFEVSREPVAGDSPGVTGEISRSQARGDLLRRVACLSASFATGVVDVCPASAQLKERGRMLCHGRCTRRGGSGGGVALPHGVRLFCTATTRGESRLPLRDERVDVLMPR